MQTKHIIATLSLILTFVATAVGQDRLRAPQPKGMNKPDLTEQLSIRSNQQRNRRPTAIGNPIGLGGTVTAGVKNRRAANLGDTGTHEVGHKGKRRNGQFRPNPTGDGTTQQFRTKAPKVPVGLTNTVAYDFRDDKNNGKGAKRTETVDNNDSMRRKQPRPRSTQKRQHKPIS